MTVEMVMQTQVPDVFLQACVSVLTPDEAQAIVEAEYLVITEQPGGLCGLRWCHRVQRDVFSCRCS